MGTINLIVEALKIAAGATFAILALFEIDTGRFTLDLILQIITLIGLLIGGSGLARMLIALKLRVYLVASHNQTFQRWWVVYYSAKPPSQQ